MKKKIQNPQAWAAEVMTTVFGMQMVLSPWPTLNLGPPSSQSNTLLNTQNFETTVKKGAEAQEHFAATYRKSFMDICIT